VVSIIVTIATASIYCALHLVSLAILQTISTGFDVLGLSAHLTLALWGVTLLVVIAVKRAAAAR
jgi:ribose/xylose/arabinose/galactoside ABC-type transport system permease subunit